MAARVVKRLPEGDDWVYELKFDGYRALIIKDEQRVTDPELAMLTAAVSRWGPAEREAESSWTRLRRRRVVSTGNLSTRRARGDC